ncbi:hypothetical protein [uncultured Modestobacter sp.]|uniref:hypothetical protein n=1 Tax=uncultured Modestobacter sp. TaxID=380048 RepID=UPI0026262616|nr:hypothetical protein [uncultured Modestobacter sp.]
MPRKRAKLPVGFDFPEAMSENGLKVTWTPEEPGAKPRIIDLTGWAGSERLRQQLARAFAVKTGTLGTWTSRSTVNDPMRWAKALTQWCEARGITSFADMQDSDWGAWKEHLEETYPRSGYIAGTVYTRALLLDVPEVSKRTKWAMSRRVGSVKAASSQATYSEPEFRALQRTARDALEAAHQRITQNYELALRDGEDDLSQEEQLKARVLSRMLTGPDPADGEVADALGSPRDFSPSRHPDKKHALFLSPEEVTAAAVLLTCLEGFNKSTLERQLIASDRPGAGETDVNVYAVPIDKKRRGRRRHFTSTYVDSGRGSSGYAYRLIAEATDPARAYLAVRGQHTDLLLISATRSGRQGGPRTLSTDVFSGVPLGGTNGIRYHSPWLPAGVNVDYQKLHRTFQTRVERAPTHNTPRTHVEKYLALDDQAREEAWEVVRAGLAQAQTRAEARLVLLLSDEKDVEDAINSGSKDTATVACRDIHCHPVTGEECRANFLMCLTCTNAVATPRHLPRLCLIHQVLEDLRGALSDSAWVRWSDDYVRLSAFLDDRVRMTPQRRKAALAEATEVDRTYVRALFAGEYDVVA